MLTSIGARAVAIRKSSGTAFWRPTTVGTRVEPEVARVPLDHKVKPAVDQSVPQIGAPAAWQRGWTGRGVKVAVLDTGVDAAHPDLAGRIAAAADLPVVGRRERDDATRPGRPVELAVGLRHQQGSVPSAFTSATVEMSYDGSTWTKLSLRPAGRDRFVAVVNHPVDRAGQNVSLRIDVQDDAGGRLQQEVTSADGIQVAVIGSAWPALRLRPPGQLGPYCARLAGE